MTPRDRAEECVRETLDGETGFAIDYIEQAITAAVATERERCAKIAEDEDELPGEPSETLLETIQSDPVFRNAGSSASNQTKHREQDSR